MPIEYDIDHKKRLVTARGTGTLTHEDVFGYQLAVWSRAEVAGYDELVDMSGVGKIDLSSIDEISTLAKLSASMDARTPTSKLAIVARDDFTFGLARMYETYRGLDTASTKEARVFRSLADALAFLQPEPTSPKSL